MKNEELEENSGILTDEIEEASKKEHTGFLDYLKYGKITPHFINDFQYWCKKLISKWNLFVEYEEFESICWAALLEQLPNFNPEISKIQTFCISRIRNEILRLWEKNKGMLRHKEEDADDPIISNTLKINSDLSLFELEFDLRQMGISINTDACQYLEEDSLTAKCLTWFNLKRNLL